MPGSLLLLVWLVLLIGLVAFDPANDRNVSPSVWIPVLWMTILASKLPSQWLGQEGIATAEGYQEGNGLDRTVFIILILAALSCLVFRSIDWDHVFHANRWLVLFLAFTLSSVLWSDFPLVAFKRWSRDLGNYIMVLVVLTDPRPIDALAALVRRVGYLLIPLSVVVIKYFPYIGKQYDPWTGAAFYVGVTTSKNMLGVLCLVSGLFFFWDILRRRADRRSARTRLTVGVDAAFLAMTLWLLNAAHSATSTACFFTGCAIVWAGHRRVAGLKMAIPLLLSLFLVLEFGFDISNEVNSVLGRDSTFTGRTDLWTSLLSFNTNPILGTGYESFWLGDRLEALWRQAEFAFKPNQAHNGYLEVYLNLGLLGLCLLGLFLVTTYARISSQLRAAPHLASLGIALWTILLAYNVTEAAFKSQLLWFTFLLTSVTVAIPKPVPAPAPHFSADLRSDLPSVF
jgi:exopolysaccharide production protein ExoQ